MGTIELTYSYLAGIIDADGFITIQRTTKTNAWRCKGPSVYHCFKVGITGTDRKPHDLAAATFGGHVTRYDGTKGHRPQFQWCASGPTALTVISAIEPYLRVKAQQAVLGRMFQELLTLHRAQQFSTQNPPYRITARMRSERDEIWREMLAQNKPRNLRVGKKAAGRLLDGREYLEFPEVLTNGK